MSEDIKNCISFFFNSLEITFNELDTELQDEIIIVTKIKTDESGLLI
jgi:hypothetical protein